MLRSGRGFLKRLDGAYEAETVSTWEIKDKTLLSHIHSYRNTFKKKNNKKLLGFTDLDIKLNLSPEERRGEQTSIPVIPNVNFPTVHRQTPSSHVCFQVFVLRHMKLKFQTTADSQTQGPSGIDSDH